MASYTYSQANCICVWNGYDFTELAQDGQYAVSRKNDSTIHTEGQDGDETFSADIRMGGSFKVQLKANGIDSKYFNTQLKIQHLTGIPVTGAFSFTDPLGNRRWRSARMGIRKLADTTFAIEAGMEEWEFIGRIERTL